MPASADPVRDRLLLAAMQPGIVYCAQEVAAALGLTVGAVRSTLEQLARKGAVARVEPAQRGMAVGWRRL